MTKDEMKEFVDETINKVRSSIMSSIDEGIIPESFDHTDIRYIIGLGFRRGVWHGMDHNRRIEVIKSIINEM